MKKTKGIGKGITKPVKTKRPDYREGTVYLQGIPTDLVNEVFDIVDMFGNIANRDDINKTKEIQRKRIINLLRSPSVASLHNGSCD